MQERLADQSDLKLKRNETLVDYNYAKDALLEKAPFTIPQSNKISMIIGDITEEKRQIALVTQNYATVKELIDRATAIDAIRNMQHEKKSLYSYGSRSSPTFQSRRILVLIMKSFTNTIQRLMIFEISLVGVVEIRTCFVYVQFTISSTMFTNSCSVKFISILLRIQIINQTLIFRILEAKSVPVISHQAAPQVQNIQSPVAVAIAPQQQDKWPQKRMNLIL
ncbi:hypothetical protein AVEN_146280-1 [Araneus ventricosus]|uniref:Uncharacterized protein n=1 Tax=Araneus ventricosus TaxID=182803 RepID=A0A4Y2U9E6_ARAVE|nr:hypothetical protein AVEN_146280-1 [Araneus ventricosus]